MTQGQGGGAGPSTVRLSFHPWPVHVRTARLVAVTVARRAGWSEELVESVRLGVGEACALALGTATAEDLVRLELDDGGPGLVARVCPVPEQGAPDGRDELPRAVLAGLTDEAVVEHHEGHSALRLTWNGTPALS